MSEIPAEALYDLTRVQEIAVSPTGDRIAFLTRESDPEKDESVNSLGVVPTDGSREPHRLTRASDASSPSWSPDGSKLGFLAAREKDPDLRVGRRADDESDTDGEDDGGGGNDEPKTQLWAFDMARGGDARQVTDREEGVSGFDWSPDGERVVVAARDPTEDEQEYLDQREEDGPIEVERLQHKFDGKGYLDEVTSYLFVVDTETRDERRLDDANDGGVGGGFLGGMEPAWGSNERIAFVANYTDWPDDNYIRDIYTIDPDGSNRRKITESELTTGTPTWSPDGNRLAFGGRQPENMYVPTEVYVVDTETGEYESVSGELDRTLAWSGTPKWLDEETLVALIGDSGWTRPVRLHVEEPSERVFEVQDSLETLGSLDVGDETLAFVTSRPAEGADIDTIDATDLDATESDPRTRLTALNDGLIEEYPMADCTRIAFESGDDGSAGEGSTEVEGIAYLPPEFDPDDPEPRGLILDIHGGPTAYDTPSFSFQDIYFTSRGYIVLNVNYRGSTSYGRSFCEVLKGNWGTVDIDDLQAGVDELIERGWVDPERLFPTGISQGGVNTAYLLTREDRWAAAAAEHGLYDLRSNFGTGDSQNWSEAEYGLPWENAEKYDEHSSITDVGEIETPLLVTAGGEDWRSPSSQSEQLYVSVRKQGIDAKLVIYPNEHHNIGDPDRAIHRLEALDDWFATYDPGRSTDRSTEE
jgi:dipeptidyl aminopeptidase/acylaminoacyl peptidase